MTTVSNINTPLTFLRPTIERLQKKLIGAQEEATTGRKADVGLGLGYQTARSITLRRQLSQLESVTQTNTGVTATLDAAQTSLEGFRKAAQTFLNALSFAQSDGSGSGQHALQSQAQSTLQAFIDGLNTSYGGAYVFAGDNSGNKPVADYSQTPPSAAQIAVADAYQAEFGIVQSDPEVVNIEPKKMQAFLDRRFTELFDQTQWQSTWSSASNTNLHFQVSASLTVEQPANANLEPVRKLASALTMVADLGTGALNENTYKVVVTKAMQLAQDALQGITDLQASIGVHQQTLTYATESISLQTTVLTNDINGLEGVNHADAAATLNEITIQLETAYTLTGRLQKLSLTQYL